MNPKATLSRHVHFAASFTVGGPEMLGLQLPEEASEATILSFVLPDGDQHAFLLDPDGKRQLVAALSGGVIVAAPGEMPASSVFERPR